MLHDSQEWGQNVSLPPSPLLPPRARGLSRSHARAARSWRLRAPRVTFWLFAAPMGKDEQKRARMADNRSSLGDQDPAFPDALDVGVAEGVIQTREEAGGEVVEAGRRGISIHSCSPGLTELVFCRGSRQNFCTGVIAGQLSGEAGSLRSTPRSAAPLYLTIETKWTRN